MPSVNKVILLGNVTKDPDIRYMPNGEAVVNVSIATNETWKDKSGQKQQKSEYHNIVAYRKLAEIIGEYLKKGSSVYFEGKLQTRQWEKDGIKRYSTEIIVDKMEMLGGKSENNPQDNTEHQEINNNAPKSDYVATQPDFEDDIPF